MAGEAADLRVDQLSGGACPCSETDPALLGRDGGHRHAGGVASRAGVQAVDERGPTETQ